ncbi:MAG: protocatechuate 3,4-dioxygenase subunit alpha [Geminicoccaceae bacterium]|nr:protocatechuate 3,4-dioxygenase subunit alpha [Geminicoccaceae bacterium]MDW8125411.1 protocatechuate 3,4-dioxygenase subunit alpha [Geminicoccaceae bacterium]
MLEETPSQTAGPYVHIGLMPGVIGIPFEPGRTWHRLAREGARGERIRIEGVVYDGTGTPVRDAVLELWQPDAAGLFPGRDPGADPAFAGFGRAAADFESGLFVFETVKPGRVRMADGRLQAPHCSLLVFARGINIHLHTRIYFDDEAAANAEDPVLALVEQESRRRTLLARRGLRDGAVVYRFDVYLQGPNETVFFDA